MAQEDHPLDDDDFPAYTMGRAAAIIGVSHDFLRRLGELKLFTPLRSPGGHRRYSRHQLRLAIRARELCDRGTPSTPRAASSASRTSWRRPCASTGSG
ncbi:hypothetical protein GCM10027610_089330 [Dactylosporangium cerinum]